jgi:hypothetical protein
VKLTFGFKNKGFFQFMEISTLWKRGRDRLLLS